MGRPAQAPVWPAQVPGWIHPGSRAGPSRLRSGPSERCISPPWTGGTMERPAAGWNDGSPDGTTLSRWDDGIIIGLRQAKRPVRLPIRPSGPAQWRGAADAQLRAASGASKPNFDA